MTTEQSNAARYVTLHDYLRVLRRHWMLIAAIALIGASAGLLDTLRQKPTYQATAQVSFQQPTQDQSIVGLGATPVESPAQLAAVASETATAPQVLRGARHRLHAPYSVAALGSEITTQVDAGSGLLLITAAANTPDLAARLANADATALVGEENGQARARFARLARTIGRRIGGLTHAGGASVGQLGFYEGELARLNTLAAFASTAQLANAAQPPSAPTGTSPIRSGGLGLLLGLLLGITIAFVRDATDRRLRSLADIEGSFPLPVLGHVHAQSLGRVVQAPGDTNGRDGFDREAFRILRRNLEFLDRERDSRLILITSGLPQEGKTTVAGSLALVMAAAGKRTVLVDCDLRKPALAGRLGVRASPGLSEYLSGSAGWHEVLTTIGVETGRHGKHNEGARNGKAVLPRAGNDGVVTASNGGEGMTGDGVAAVTAHDLAFIPAGAPSSRSAELLGSSRFGAFLDALGDGYDVVVLDSTPLLPVSDTLEILPHVDAMIICARASQSTREEASAVQAALSHYPERPTGLVVTGIRPGDSDYADYAYDYRRV